MELDKEREEHAITKAYYRQVDDAYTREAEELATMMKKSQGTSEQKAENKPTEKSKEEKTGKPRSFSPPETRDQASIQVHQAHLGMILRIQMVLLAYHHHGEVLRLMTTCLNRTSR